MILLTLMKPVITISLQLLARLFRSGGVLIGAVLILYFGLLALDNDRGYASLQVTQRQVGEAQAKLAHIKTEREAIERKVIALRPGSLDRDMLDEEVRSTLGYVRPGEMVILGK